MDLDKELNDEQLLNSFMLFELKKRQNGFK